MNQLTKERRVRVISALVEGASVNSTVRMTGQAGVSDHVWAIDEIVALLS